MTLLVETTVPERGHLALRIHADVEINISAEQAQQRVTRFAHQSVSSQMHGGTPMLILKARAYWQVPIHLTFPSVGDAGIVGTLLVDVETGEVDTNPLAIKELEQHAEHLAAHFAPISAITPQKPTLSRILPSN